MKKMLLEMAILPIVLMPTLVSAQGLNEQSRLEDFLTEDGMTPFCAAQNEPAVFCHAIRAIGDITLGEISNGQPDVFIARNWLEFESVSASTVLSAGLRLIERRSIFPDGSVPVERLSHDNIDED